MSESKPTQTKTLSIVKWKEIFERAESRKLQRLTYYCPPSGCDSSGYLELMVGHEEDGVTAFGVFCALCQFTATLPADRRGMLVKTNGKPYTIRFISSLIRIPEEIVDKSIAILTEPQISWLEWVDSPDVKGGTEESPGDLPEESQQSPADLPLTTGNPPDRGEEIRGEENRGEGTTDNFGVSGDDLKKSKELEAIISGIRSLQKNWNNHFSEPEMRALADTHESFRGYDFSLVRDWFEKSPDKRKPKNRLNFIQNGVSHSSLTRAEDWKKEIKKNKSLKTGDQF